MPFATDVCGWLFLPFLSFFSVNQWEIMNSKIEENTRAQIASFLPDVLTSALLSYQQFMEQDVSKKASEFKDYHNACKVAIAHIELLIKLAKWADLPGSKASGGDGNEVLLAMMATAESELKKHHEKYDDKQLKEQDEDACQ